MPFQSKSKEYKRLEEEGYVEYAERTLYFNDGFPPMIVKGWILTHKGRIAYCDSASEQYEKLKEENPLMSEEEITALMEEL